jgi:4-hydroxy-tetrahydrodipicolinate synthase
MQATETAMLCDIPILSGDDSLTLPIMSVGGVGVISVISNACEHCALAHSSHYLPCRSVTW